MKIFNNSKNKKIKLSNIISQSNIFLLHNINNKRQLLNKVSKILEDQTNFSKEAILDLLLKKYSKVFTWNDSLVDDTNFIKFF